MTLPRRFALALLFLAACSHHHGANGDLGGAKPDGSSSGECTPCLSDNDCGGGTCVQLGGDTYCATTCTRNTDCMSDESCLSVSTATGDQANVCVDNANVCGSGPVALDMGTPTNTMQCGTLVGPTVTAGCHGCSGSTCQANGCYGGWWCNTGSNHCQSPPTTCSSGGTDGGSGTDGGTVGTGFGTTPTGTITASGGSLSRLLFAVVGDTRPPSVNDTSGYPTAIATQIFGDVQNMSAHPPFIVTTGDYQYSTPTGTQSGPQLDKYIAAHAAYTGTIFPAMGNHECTGYTASNCVTGSSDLTNNNNYANYLSKILAPLSQTKPYYSIDINAIDNSWTAKFVFIAANAWDSTQSSWLSSTLAKPTTYTFIVRHEPTEANTAPGVTPSDTIISKYPYTIAIVGHTHTYEREGRQVVVGNGGAPLTGSKNYGYAVFSQQADGSISIDMVDYSTNAIDPSFHFAVKADGSAAP